MPACRTGGSSTLTVVRCFLISTPRSAGVILSIFFFLAFMMLGSVAYRGSFSRKSAVTTAGRGMLSVSRPESTSRVTVALPPSTFSSDANAPCGQPINAASIWPVWFASSSIACLPSTTSSGPSLSQTPLKSFATCSGTVSSSVTTCTARSAPIASAVRSCSCEAVGPTETAITSVAIFASLSRTASSTAISSNGFMLIFTFAVSTPDLSGFTRILTA
mmetsp:Transcript_18327/g.54168  ORF Transcript_18327/g.54168 Transcript_18327/m.54168 type:complete len:218 (+) Transcript_18327:386-1039(+)